MIGEDLARIRGLGERGWMALQDRVLLVVHPERAPDNHDGALYGFARLYSAPRAPLRRVRRSCPSSRAGRSWRRGTFSCRGCSTSPGTSCVSGRVERRSACRSLAARPARGWHAFVQNLWRGHYELAVEELANRQVAIAFDELALVI
jgi:hypothetical protein